MGVICVLWQNKFYVHKQGQTVHGSDNKTDKRTNKKINYQLDKQIARPKNGQVRNKERKTVI